MTPVEVLKPGFLGSMNPQAGGASGPEPEQAQRPAQLRRVAARIQRPQLPDGRSQPDQPPGLRAYLGIPETAIL